MSHRLQRARYLHFHVICLFLRPLAPLQRQRAESLARKTFPYECFEYPIAEGSVKTIYAG
jgi:hypothetical protein